MFGDEIPDQFLVDGKIVVGVLCERDNFFQARLNAGDKSAFKEREFGLCFSQWRWRDFDDEAFASTCRLALRSRRPRAEARAFLFTMAIAIVRSATASPAAIARTTPTARRLAR